jgi:predicted DNA-binding protein
MRKNEYVLTFKVEEELYDLITSLAIKHRKTKSEIIREAIKKYLEANNHLLVNKIKKTYVTIEL